LIFRGIIEVAIIYFTTYQSKDELFTLNFQLTGFLDYEKKSVPVLDGITKDEANESWITIYR